MIFFAEDPRVDSFKSILLDTCCLIQYTIYLYVTSTRSYRNPYNTFGFSKRQVFSSSIEKLSTHFDCLVVLAPIGMLPSLDKQTILIKLDCVVWFYAIKINIVSWELFSHAWHQDQCKDTNKIKNEASNLLKQDAPPKEKPFHTLEAFSSTVCHKFLLLVWWECYFNVYFIYTLNKNDQNVHKTKILLHL